MKVMVHVKQVQPDIARSKHEEHSHGKYAKKGFFGYREKKINIPHTSWTWMRYDHKALIFSPIRKDNRAFPISTAADEDFLMKA